MDKCPLLASLPRSLPLGGWSCAFPCADTHRHLPPPHPTSTHASATLTPLRITPSTAHSPAGPVRPDPAHAPYSVRTETSLPSSALSCPH